MDPLNYFGLMPNAEKPELDKAYRLMIEKYSFDENADDVTREAHLCKQREIDSVYQSALAIAMQNEQNRNVRQTIDKLKNEFDNNAQNIINLINDRQFKQAEIILGNYNLTNYAKWHYIYACLRLSQGWMNDAYIHMRIAFELEPTEPVYANSFRQMQNMKDGNKLTSGQIGAIIAGGTFAVVGTACVCLIAPEHLFPHFNFNGCYNTFGIPFTECFADECSCCAEPCQDGCAAYCNSQCDVCCGCDSSTG